MIRNIFHDYCKSIRKHTPQRWKRTKPTSDDISWIRAECEEVSPFDPAGLRRSMLNQLPALACWEDAAGNRVLALGDKPDDAWSLTLQAFGQNRQPFRICWLAHPALRTLPASGETVGPGHINGGYTVPCDTRRIMIYRKEEALRVLIHELLHATCTDDPRDSVPIMEAKTEAWAEVILCCILAKGELEKALRLWKIQSSWVLAQTKRLIEEHGVVGPEVYAWRYTVGKKEYLDKWGLLTPMKTKISVPLSTRLTSPLVL